MRDFLDGRIRPDSRRGFAHVLGRWDRERPAPDPAEEARLRLGDNPQIPYGVDSIDRRIVSQVAPRSLIASGVVPDKVSRLMNPERRLLVPARPDERPHSQFLQYYRERVFKG